MAKLIYVSDDDVQHELDSVTTEQIIEALPQDIYDAILEFGDLDDEDLDEDLDEDEDEDEDEDDG